MSKEKTEIEKQQRAFAEHEREAAMRKRYADFAVVLANFDKRLSKIEELLKSSKVHPDEDAR